jgi:hypothetical protein
VAALAFVLCSLLWTGCKSEKDREQEITASLPEVPEADVAKLKVVPHNQMLATSEVRLSPNAPPDTGIHPDCTTDDVETDFNAEVTYAVFFCGISGGTGVISVGTGVFSPSSRTPTHKVEVAKLSKEQRAVFTTPPGGIWSWADSGPWQGVLRRENSCSETCNVQNTLSLTNTPNPVTIEWDGQINDHPNLFEFVGKLQSLGTTDFGRCHSQNVAHRPVR